MALPVGVTTCTVTFGRATSYLGNDAEISGTLSADRAIVHAASGVRIDSSADLVPNDAGYLSFNVPHVDQAGMLDASTGDEVAGWFYILNATITPASGVAPVTVTKRFQVFEGQESVDLDLVADGPTLPTFRTPNSVVTSVAGLTGNVSAEDLAGALPAPTPQDTGWRDISALFTPPQPAATVVMKRVDGDGRVWLDPEQRGVADWSFLNGDGDAVPGGFKPAGRVRIGFANDSFEDAGFLIISDQFSGVYLAPYALGVGSYPIDDEPPTTLPGTAYDPS